MTAFYLVQIHLRSILNHIVILQFLLDLFHLCIQRRPLLLCGRNFCFRFLEFCFQTRNRLFQFFNLTSSAEQITGILKCSTTHCSARIDQISFQRNDTQGLTVLSCQTDPGINVVCHKSSSKKMLCKRCKFIFYRYQLVRRADHARLAKGFCPGKSLSPMNRCQWKESCTSIPVLLQITNHFFCSLFVCSNDILDTASKCDLHRSLIFFIYFDQISHNPQDFRLTAFLLHHTTDTVPITIVTLRKVPQRLQTRVLPVISILPVSQVFICLSDLFLQSGNLCFIVFDLFYRIRDLP